MKKTLLILLLILGGIAATYGQKKSSVSHRLAVPKTDSVAKVHFTKAVIKGFALYIHYMEVDGNGKTIAEKITKEKNQPVPVNQKVIQITDDQGISKMITVTQIYADFDVYVIVLKGNREVRRRENFYGIYKGQKVGDFIMVPVNGPQLFQK